MIRSLLRRLRFPLIVLAVLTTTGCASLKPVVKTVFDIATEACVAAFAKAKPAMSPTDIAKAFCTTAEDIQPFVDAELDASKAAVARKFPENQ